QHMPAVDRPQPNRQCAGRMSRKARIGDRQQLEFRFVHIVSVVPGPKLASESAAIHAGLNSLLGVSPGSQGRSTAAAAKAGINLNSPIMVSGAELLRMLCVRGWKTPPQES